MKIILLVIFIFSITYSYSNYKEYTSRLSEAEQLFIKRKFDPALKIYMDVLKDYDYPYAKEVIQAVYISCFANDSKAFKFLIKEAIKCGLTKLEYNSLLEVWHLNNSELMNEDMFSSNRDLYLRSLKREKMTEYVKLDFERKSVELLLLRSRKSDKNLLNYYSVMNTNRNRYLELIDLFGYPNDKETGRKFSNKIVKKVGNQTNSVLFCTFNRSNFLDTKYLGKIVKFEENKSKAIWSSNDPGAWFLTHYINSSNINELDTVFYKKIKEGVEALKTSPYLLINMLESTRLLENDLALTYYSNVWLSKRMSYSAKYNLENEEKLKINQARDKLGFRSLENEEKLLRFLYKIKTSEELPKEFNNEALKVISFENRIFLNYMV